jgi:anti-anti-sigma factor
VTGEVDTATSSALCDAVLHALHVETVRELIVDLDAVTLLAAAGITALLAGQQTAARRGVGYRIANPHGIVHRVLDITDPLNPLTKPARREST